MMEPFRELPTGGNDLLDKIQQRVRRALDSIAKVVTNDVLVTLDVPPGADVRLYHPLNGSPRAWEVVGRNANAVVWESTTTNPLRNRYLLLRSSANVTITVRLS